MALITRASLPEEFFDITSARVLKQPLPQFVFAQLAKLALGSAMLLAAAGQMGFSPERRIPDSGAAYTLPGADNLNLAAPDAQMSNAIISVAELAVPQVGHTIRINRPRYGSGGFTLGQREIPAGSNISTTPMDLQSEQVTVTLKRYGGPYDPGQSAVAPFGLDRFDASRSVHSIAQEVGLHMQVDFDRWLDTVVAAFLSSGTTTLLPAGVANVNIGQAAGDMPMDVDMLFRGVETLRNANVQPFPNGRYRAFISPTQERQLTADPQCAQYVRYSTDKMNPVTAPANAPPDGFLGQVQGCDIYLATTLPVTNNTNSIPVTSGIMVAPAMLGIGAGQMPRVATSTADNYGESALVVWLSYLGFNLADARFGVVLATD